ncbi:HD-like signal output (HDOD) domain, no enzymatic activity [Allopseudospirillum japonicum]|uniref:HD-like signal output (HDOD) domain, no enzymatic activity n=1 Tax=Allopseudospirillum japonicum TaxID=64971 RepID=A0A1H6R1C2_9GAMM|nr:HDOD domain-containing protein [Allopseudospirillum japonicum]SEI49583.1 HD-like signal output (HDOD) domain, no enzymatic activity [Allopseudospirillum japonicum]
MANASDPLVTSSCADTQQAQPSSPEQGATSDRLQGLAAHQVPRRYAQPHQLMRSTVLEDEQGLRVQAVFPANTLLDLQRLREDGPQWRAISPQQRQSILDKYHLQSLPALPELLEMPLWIDERVLKADKIFIESGDPRQLLEFSPSEYAHLLETSPQIEHAIFAVPLAETRPNLNAPHNDEEEIRQAIETITSRRIRARLEESIEIAPLPVSAQSILELHTQEEASNAELASVIESDPSLASQVISWANSPYYGVPGSIRSIHDAVIRVLGYDLTMNLALGLAMGRHLQMPSDGVHGYQSYWRDAVRRALLVETLVKKIQPVHRPYTGLSYLAGLLHNFGYLVLAEVFPPYFSLYCRYQEANPHVPPMYLERFLFGITREQIASHLFQAWGLPEEVCIAVRQQYNPAYVGKHHKYANLLYLAHQLLHPYMEHQFERLPLALYERLHLQAVEAKEVLAHLQNLEGELDTLVHMLEKHH